MPKGRKGKSKSLWECFEAFHKLDKKTGCWLWTGNLDNRGYGRLVVRGTRYAAHRLSYDLHIGTPKGYILHSCDNPRCVNPHHLYDGALHG